MYRKISFLICLVLAVGIVGSAWAVPPNVVHEWKFENNLNDTSGSGNHGTVDGNPVYVTGVSGKALQFDGVDDKVECLSPCSLMSLRRLSQS